MVSQAGGQGGAIATGVNETEPKDDGLHIMAYKRSRGNLIDRSHGKLLDLSRSTGFSARAQVGPCLQIGAAQRPHAHLNQKD